MSIDDYFYVRTCVKLSIGFCREMRIMYCFIKQEINKEFITGDVLIFLVA